MAAITYPEVELPSVPPTEPLPRRQRGGWTPRPEPRIGLDLGSDDDMLMLENRTEISWSVYHNYHHLGIIDSGELLIFHLCKRGTLNVRPHLAGGSIEYLVVPLAYSVNQVYIYRRQIDKAIEVYDMRAL